MTSINLQLQIRAFHSAMNNPIYGAENKNIYERNKSTSIDMDYAFNKTMRDVQPNLYSTPKLPAPIPIQLKINPEPIFENNINILDVLKKKPAPVSIDNWKDIEPVVLMKEHYEPAVIKKEYYDYVSKELDRLNGF